MEPKPAHLGVKYAEQFKDTSIVQAYHYRPSYNNEAIQTLLALITDEPRVILDVGCGTGDLARRLVDEVERVDAVDFSQAMLERGKSLPGGDHPHLNWIYGCVEDVVLQSPYALITAGESLHWMEWDIALPLFRTSLTPHGYLAIVTRGEEPNPWSADLQVIINQFTTNHDYRPYNIVEELERRHLFQKHDAILTQSVPFVQSAEAYIQSFHSRNGFSRERMGEEAANGFDDAVRKVIAPFLQDGQVTLAVSSAVVWGILSPRKCNLTATERYDTL